MSRSTERASLWRHRISCEPVAGGYMKSYRASGGMQYWKGSDYTPALCLRNWICSPAPERDASVRRLDLLVYVTPPLSGARQGQKSETLLPAFPLPSFLHSFILPQPSVFTSSFILLLSILSISLPACPLIHSSLFFSSVLFPLIHPCSFSSLSI